MQGTYAVQYRNNDTGNAFTIEECEAPNAYRAIVQTMRKARTGQQGKYTPCLAAYFGEDGNLDALPMETADSGNLFQVTYSHGKVWAFLK